MSRLYIIMRTFVNSLNPGRAMAQAAHAHGAAHQHLTTKNEDWFKWCHEASGFGTTIVLSDFVSHINSEDLLHLVNDKNHLDFNEAVDYLEEIGISAGIVNDPDYVIKDGSVSHSVAFDTCMWYFVNDAEMENEQFKRFNSLFCLHA